MNKKEIEEIVSNKLANDLNFNEMQIRHETITDITNECGTILLAQRCSHAYHLAHSSRSAHYAG